MKGRHARNNKALKGVSKPILILTGIAALVIVVAAGLHLGGIFKANPAPNSTLPQTVTFNFNGGQSVPSLRQSTPFNYTSGGVMASFSSPNTSNAFSVQSAATTSLDLSEFAGNYLYQNVIQSSPLVIQFNTSLSSITLTFATGEYHGGPGIDPSTLVLAAYSTASGIALVGSTSSHGTWPNGSTYPQGTLIFNASGQPFDLVRLDLPQTQGAASVFMIDNIVVVTRP